MAGKNCKVPNCAHWHHSQAALKYFFKELESVTPENYKKEEFGYRLLGIDSIDDLPVDVEDSVRLLKKEVATFWRTWKILKDLGSPTRFHTIFSLLGNGSNPREGNLRTSPTSAQTTEQSGSA